MAQPGWYPDPENPQQARYWDGQSWAPSTPQGPTPQRSESNYTWLIVAAVVLATVAAAVYFAFFRDASDPTPTDPQPPNIEESQWDERPTTEPPSPSPEPSDTAPGSETVECPVVRNERESSNEGGRIHGGGLSFAMPEAGWRESSSGWSRVLTDQGSATRSVANSSWVNVLVVGLAPAAEGFTDPRVTAHQVMDCHLTSSSYPGLQGKDIIHDEAITVDGHQGWWVQVHAASSDAPGGGSTADYIVLDVGDDEGLAVFWGGALDSDAEAQDAIRAARESLRVG